MSSSTPLLSSVSSILPSDEERFAIEIEFVQNLCNLQYLHYLAQNQYLSDQAFLHYLQYLQYWKEPEYIVLLRFPQCLVFLDALIKSSQFRKELVFPQFIAFCHEQQGLQWLHDRYTSATEDA